MSAMEPLCLLIGVNPDKLSKKENSLLEADLFTRILDELKEVLRQQYKPFFHYMGLTATEENEMLEENFIRLILNGILSTNEYTVQGIARYTDTHEDIIEELASGINTKPSASCFRKVIEIDRLVRPELYQAIGKKIAVEFLPRFVDPDIK